jgi:uncharacterized protein (TIGR03435 family)
MDLTGQKPGNLAGALGGFVIDRPVLDKTGIAGEFTFHLVFAHDEKAPGNLLAGFPSPFEANGIPAAPSIDVVLEQQLGLNIRPDRDRTKELW